MIEDKEHAVMLGLWLMSEGLQENPDYEKMAKVKEELEAFVQSGNEVRNEPRSGRFMVNCNRDGSVGSVRFGDGFIR